jgi:hypothetical protein
MKNGIASAAARLSERELVTPEVFKIKRSYTWTLHE